VSAIARLYRARPFSSTGRLPGLQGGCASKPGIFAFPDIGRKRKEFSLASSAARWRFFNAELS